MVPIVFLKSVELFQGLDDDELAILQPLCSDELKIRNETTLFGENDTAHHIYALVEGNVDLRFKLPARSAVKENTIMSLEPGSIFGWSGLVPPHNYTLSAFCTGDRCTALRIDRDDLMKVLEEHPRIGFKVMKNMTHLIGERYLALQNQIARELGQDGIDGW